MIDIAGFLTKHPLYRRVGDFSAAELETYRHIIPPELFEFLSQEQRSIYGDGFFWTVSPADFHDVFDNWGLDGQNCYAFLRSSFGCIAYYFNDKYYVLNPHEGFGIGISNKNIKLLFNLSLVDAVNLEDGFFYDLHLKLRHNLKDLDEDEMYTLVPAIPLGGSKDTSKVEVVKMNVQLDILAQLHDLKASQ